MKKYNALYLIYFTSLFANAEYTIFIDDNDNHEYRASESSETITYSEWTNYNAEYNCSFDKIESDLYYGQEYTQTETCKQDQKRTKTVTTFYETGISKSESIEEYQTIDLTETALITGTHLEESCANILAFNPDLSTGSYIALLQNNTEISLYCDMDTSGGGWTRLSRSALINSTNFDKVITKRDGVYQLINDSYYVVGHVDGSSILYSDFRFDLYLNFDYQEFKFEDYNAKDYSQISGDRFDLMTANYKNYTWNTRMKDVITSGGGDIAFGTIYNNYPTTSYVEEGHSYSEYRGLYPFTKTTIYDNGIKSNIFSFKTGERGTEDERIIFWQKGYIWFR